LECRTFCWGGKKTREKKKGVPKKEFILMNGGAKTEVYLRGGGRGTGRRVAGGRESGRVLQRRRLTRTNHILVARRKDLRVGLGPGFKERRNRGCEK